MSSRINIKQFSDGDEITVYEQEAQIIDLIVNSIFHDADADADADAEQLAHPHPSFRA